MFVAAKARERLRSVLSCGIFARPWASRRLRLVLIGVVAMCLSFALAAGARVGAGASARGSRAQTPPFPLSVRQISARTLQGRIVGTATIVNAGNAQVRSTTGLLGLSRGSGGRAEGILAFSVPALPPQGSKRVRFTARLVRAMPIGSGTYTVLICTDIDSQIQRFARSTHCSPGPRLAILTRSRPRASGRVPNTIIRTDFARVSRSSTAVVRFGSTVDRSTFQCSLDGAPWLACRSPQSYPALVDGAHVFDVSAISPLGREDPTHAHRSWTVDTIPPAATFRRPVSAGKTGVSALGTFTLDTTPPAHGSGGAVFRGATSSVSKTYSIGGTVSGLSGTVVLQDNGGDDLSVSSNGAFTFATRLATGAAYKVTVKTNPSGQSCSVSGGTGTVASANVTNVAVTCITPGQDNFNRANGGLGPAWVAMSDGGLSIVSQRVVGTAGKYAGDIRVAESYGSDQYSQIEVTTTQLSGGQWVGPTVRSQNGGQDTYLGIYFWNNGTPQLRLYKRTAGTWTQLGTSYNSGPLPAGTKLTLSAVGSTHRLPAERHHAHRRDRQHADRRRPRRDDLRRRHRRQLGWRHAEHLLDWWQRVWVGGHGRVAGQRWR